MSKNAIFLSECSDDMCLVKNWFSLYLGNDGVKELVIICDHVHFSLRINGLKTASCLLKGRGRGKKPCDTDTGDGQSVKGLTFY